MPCEVYQGLKHKVRFLSSGLTYRVRTKLSNSMGEHAGKAKLWSGDYHRLSNEPARNHLCRNNEDLGEEGLTSRFHWSLHPPSALTLWWTLLPSSTAGAFEFASFSWQAVISFKVYLRATQMVDEGKLLCIEIFQVRNVEGMIELESYHLAKTLME